MYDIYLSINEYWDDYRDWIVSKYLEMSDRNAKKYRRIIEIMHETDYIYNVDRDESRALDGIYNRSYYLDEEDLPRDLFDDRACSVLEMLAVLAKKYDSDWIGTPGENDSDLVFIEFLDNLFGTKRISSISDRKIREYLDVWMSKIDYDKPEYVTIFPIKNKKIDYKNMELWSQMMAYITDKYYS